MSSRLDLTQGSMSRLLVRLAVPTVIGMVMQILYLLVDLYFVGRLGQDAVAAVSISGNCFFVMAGLSLVIGTGGMALIAQAFGRQDHPQAGRVFQQSLLLSLISGTVLLLIGLALARPFIAFFGGRGQAFTWGVEYFQVFSVSFLPMLLLFVIGSCFRGTGDTKTPMLVMVQSTFLNLILDPLLIFGLLGLPRLGVRGAAIASLLAQLLALGVYGYLIFVKGSPMRLSRSWRPDLGLVRRSLAIGLPSGLTFYLLALNLFITYRVASVYGTPALASIGIGGRIVQAVYLPAVAITSAVAAMVGQNYGARNFLRVREAFLLGLGLTAGVMLLGTGVCLVFPAFLIGVFSADQEVIGYGVAYLTVVSLGNVVVGTIMVSSSVFQGLGKTYPSLVAALLDNALFALLVFTLPVLFGWGFASIWWIKLSTAVAEMGLVTAWLRLDLKRVRALLKSP